VKIAVVGSGVSGLVVAYLLYGRAEITIFEARDRIGGHVNTVELEDADGRPLRIDTGFIVYNETNYPLFTSLLTRLNVATQPSTMSFSVRCDRTGLEYNGSTVGGLFSQRRNVLNPRFHRMLRDILRFNREAPGAVRRAANHLTLGEYVRGADYSTALSEHYLVPMGSALWSMPRSRVLEMPARFFVDFFEHHRMLTVDDRPQWRVVSGGSDRYVDALVAPFRDRIRTEVPISEVRRSADHVSVNGERFDHVVMACHADQALSALADPTPAERDVLGALPYQSNEVVLHTDTATLPRLRRAWGSWNYHIRGNDDAPATVTYNMNHLQALESPRTYCVTLNATERIDPDAIVYRARYDHPLYTSRGVAAQERHREISGAARTHYCGAYWGFGFHEDGVRSAVRVARRFGATL